MPIVKIQFIGVEGNNWVFFFKTEKRHQKKEGRQRKRI